MTKMEDGEPAVLNWDRVIHKNVRTKEGVELGNIAADQGDSLAILSSGHREYIIPKSLVEGFDGSEVSLDLPISEAGKYMRKT